MNASVRFASTPFIMAGGPLGYLPSVLDAANGDYRGLAIDLLTMGAGKALRALPKLNFPKISIEGFSLKSGSSAISEATSMVNPNSLIRTEVGTTWKATTLNVAKIMNSAKTEGILRPVDVFVHNGKSYIINGHHRVHAAIRLGQNVPVNYSNTFGNYSNIFHLQNAAHYASMSPFKVDGRLLKSLLK